MPRAETGRLFPTLAAALAVGLAFPPLHAEEAPPPDERLKRVEDALERGRVETEGLKRKAQTIGAELAALKGETVVLARRIQEHEENLSALEARLADLKSSEAAGLERLDRRRRQMIGVLTAIERLAWRPSEALMAQPTTPSETVRSAILLRAALPKIEESARELRKALAGLGELRESIVLKRQQANATAAKLLTEQRHLEGMAQRKAELQNDVVARSREAEERLRRLAGQAENLRDLLARLEEERRQREAAEAEARRRAEEEALRAAAAAAEAKARAAAEAEIEARTAAEAEAKARAAAAAEAKAKAQAAKTPDRSELSLAALPPGRPFSEAKGHLPFPARGRVAIRYGETTEVGVTHKGVSIEARDGAQVVAPYDGEVVFAGPFRGYGLLLIIEHGEGYHTLLAGMARVDAVVGQRVLAGEPIAIMAQTEGKPTLYVELRRNGQPINPLPWLTARKHKVGG